MSFLLCCAGLSPPDVSTFLARALKSEQPGSYLSLERNTPVSRAVVQPESGKVITIPQVGRLHHRYRRRAGATRRPCPFCPHLGDESILP
jgi:hypothetical protein